ncbi:hypothetical protein IAD21_00450 [Abditibacteriota bacterium]|nr:hypothetical protein IAD21_00450 [Abditibacteriota bacterium]
MKSLVFQPKSPLLPTFTDVIEINGIERRLAVFWWEDRLVAHEESSGLWWGTFDVGTGRDARALWREDLAKQRVGRLFSLQRGFPISQSNGATLVVGPHLFHVLVAQDNSGIARSSDEVTWHSFPAGALWGIRKPLANPPTIWSPRFHTKFARRFLGALAPIYEQEVLATMPARVRALWPQGATALPIRLVTAALAMGWGDILRWGNSYRRQLTPLQFWTEVLGQHPRLASLQSDGPFSFPDSLFQSPEVAIPGNITVYWSYYSSQDSRPSVFSWHSPQATLRIEFGGTNTSAHEQLEFRLELRDWLARFFPAGEVESWFDR